MGDNRKNNAGRLFVKGIVTKITAFGAFVELDNGIEALIHVTELSDQPFGKVEDVVKKGDEITAKVIKLDPEHKKIALSIKEYLVATNTSIAMISSLEQSQEARRKKKKTLRREKKKTMNKDLVAIFEYLEREKGIKRDIIIAAIEESLRAAARKSIKGLINVSRPHQF